MGIIRRGILGGFSGKVANVVGSSWKGIAVMRALPLSVTNPRTVGQVEQRSAFSLVSKFASAILTTWVKPLWDRSAQSMSGYNAFIQQNVDVVKSDKELILENLTMSKGKLGATPLTGTVSSSSEEVVLSWPGLPSGSYQMVSDRLYLLIFNDQNELIASSSGEVTRGEVGTSFDGLPISQGKTYTIVSAFAREDGTIVGDASILKKVAS